MGLFGLLKSTASTSGKAHKLPWARGEKAPVKKFMAMAGSQCGITEQEIFNRRQERHNLKDAIWSLCNENLLKNQKVINFENLRAIYSYMIWARYSQGKSTSQFVKRKLYFDLLQYKEMGMPIVITISGHDSCAACKKLDGKEFDIEEAIKIQPLPPKDCTCLRCTCSY